MFKKNVVNLCCKTYLGKLLRILVIFTSLFYSFIIDKL